MKFYALIIPALLIGCTPPADPEFKIKEDRLASATPVRNCASGTIIYRDAQSKLFFYNPGGTYLPEQYGEVPEGITPERFCS